jgi:hypothetical protein
VWQSGGVVFLALKMSQDPVDGVLLLDASDDFDRPTAATANLKHSIDEVLALNTGDGLDRSSAMTANLDIDIEDALESLSPRHRDAPFSEREPGRVASSIRPYNRRRGRGNGFVRRRLFPHARN